MQPFDDLKSGIAASAWQPGDTREVAGYRGFDSYPGAFQAAEFPKHGSSVRISGSNQAFFFVKGVKEGNRVVAIEPNTVALKTLFENIVAQGASPDKRPFVALQVDADVFENPERFVDKYQSHRPEEDEATRRALLGKEIELIKDFAESKMRLLAAEVLGRPPNSLEVTKFFVYNFQLQGLITQKALPFATWEIETKDNGLFLAVQAYKDRTYMLDRPWQMGLEPELRELKKSRHPGAKQVLEAMDYTHRLRIANVGLLRPGARRQASDEVKPQNS